MKEINRYIDHTILKADATSVQVERICQEAMKYSFASVCVNSCWVSTCKRLLEGSSVKVCSVVGFPLGAMSTQAKAFEAECCVNDGADEVDMVINIGKLKAGDLQGVKDDILQVRQACGPDTILKVIIETCLLTDAEKREVCMLAKEARADFVKTSTGFSTGGATIEDVRLMRETVGPQMGVKASGGVRSLEDALAVIEAGATRIGASSGVAIMEGLSSKEDY